MVRIFSALTLIIVCSCAIRNAEENTLKTGMWRATLQIQNEELPFNLEVQRDSSGGFDFVIINGDERIVLNEVTVVHDSITIGLHVFDASIKARIADDKLTGYFIKHYETDYAIPFRAEYNKTYRFKISSKNAITKNFSGTYNVHFIKDEKDTTQAVGIFNQTGSEVTGTFLTATGDYRYLQGNIINNEMHLSAFDGNSAYLFTAAFVGNEVLAGKFYSGKTSFKEWIATKNDSATLSDSALTFLKDGYDKVEFTFPDVNGKLVSLSDEKYKNKVVILQIFGTWCPNCLDETKFLAPWYNLNKRRGVEIIGLAFERKDDFTYASTRVKKMIAELNVTYDFVIAGTNNAEQASKALPMLNNISTYPTTIYIGKDGKVTKISSGFFGQGTGKYFEQFKAEFNETINSLLRVPDSIDQ